MKFPSCSLFALAAGLVFAGARSACRRRGARAHCTDVPTIAEAGVPGYEMSPWIGVFAPAGTAKPLIDKLSAEIIKALTLPEVAQSLSGQALDPWTSTPGELAARLRTDYDKYAQLIKLTGAKID